MSATTSRCVSSAVPGNAAGSAAISVATPHRVTIFQTLPPSVVRQTLSSERGVVLADHVADFRFREPNPRRINELREHSDTIRRRWSSLGGAETTGPHEGVPRRQCGNHGTVPELPTGGPPGIGECRCPRWSRADGFAGHAGGAERPDHRVASPGRSVPPRSGSHGIEPRTQRLPSSREIHSSPGLRSKYMTQSVSPWTPMTGRPVG